MAWPTTSSRSKNWGTEILTDTDLEGQLDILHSYFNDSLNGTSGHGHTGGTSDGKKISLTTAVSGILPIANGGTGAATLENIYPIGIVVTFGVSTNPNTLFGFGTWTAIAGRVIVGIDAGQTEFDSLNETGGAKTHTLTTAEMPAHTHGLTGSSGGAQNSYRMILANDNPTSTTTDSAGSGNAHNNLQPYIVKYVWERTA